MHRSRTKYFLLLFFVVISTFILDSCLRSDKKSSDQIYASLVDTTKYVGKEACQKCHADKYETYIHTGMGLSFDTASKQKSSAEFSKDNVIYDRFRNMHYYPHWQKDSFLISEFRLDGRDTIFRRSEKVSWIVGSGQHTNSHLMNVNGYIYQMPATFYTQRRAWDLPPGFEGGFNSRFSRQIGLECITCHNAYPEFVLGSENKYNFIDNGIDCERCHGPGKTHIDEKLAGKIVDVKTAIDYSIVNPAKLSSNLQMDVCQRCHIQGNAVLKEGKSFLDFRPGMHLSDVMNIFMPVYKGDDESHIMASHAERLKMSRCFVSSTLYSEKNNIESGNVIKKDNLTCITCHNPHISVKQTNVSVFNNACKNCHYNSLENKNFSEKAKECKEDLIIRNKVNDNCASCHMPKNGTIDIPHVTTTDHLISIPSGKKEVVTIKEFATLQCINNPSAAGIERGNAFLSYYEKFSPNPVFLDSAKYYFDDANNDSIRKYFKSLIRYSFLKNDYALVIRYATSITNSLDILKTKSYSNDDAWTAYRIGESYYQSGDISSAIKFYDKAVLLAPYQLDFRSKLASAQQDSGNNEGAKENYKFIIKENPDYVSAYVNYGFLLLSVENNPDAANEMYDKALSLDPDNTQGLFNKAGLLIYQNQIADARNTLKRILKIDKNNKQAQLLISRLGRSNP